MDLFEFAEQTSRASDPKPSHVASINIETKLVGLRRLFVDTCKRIGGGTAQEIAAEGCDCPREAESVRKRAKECVDREWVRIREARKCRVTGNLATVYEVV